MGTNERGLVELACPMCESTGAPEVYPSRLGSLDAAFDYLNEEDGHYRIVRCGACGLTYSSPVLPEAEIIELYERCEIDNITEQNAELGVEANMRRYLSRLKKNSGIDGGRLLDVGCGTGVLLNCARDAGYEPFGTEPSAGAANYARTNFKLDNVATGAYGADSYPENSFDLITLIHVIDHLFDPRSVLTAMHKHLRPGGGAVIATHNIESWLARLTGENFIAYSVQHICYFTPETLRAMAESCGFTATVTRGSYTSYPLRHYAENGIKNRRLRGAALSFFTATRLSECMLTFPFGNIELYVRKD